MTKAEIKALAAQQLSDAGYAHWTEAEIEGHIDRGYADFQDRTHTMRKHGTITLSEDEPLYACPTDLLYLHRVEDPDGVVIPFASTFYMDANYGTNWRETDGPTLKYIVSDAEGIADADEDTNYYPTIRVYPIPDDTLDAETLAIDYALRLTVLENADTPLFRSELHVALVWYVLEHCYLKELDRQDFQKSDYFHNRYMRAVRREKANVASGFVPSYGTVQIPWFV